MNPADLIIQGLQHKEQAAQQQEASQEAAEREFTASQFQAIVKSVADSNKALVGFLTKYSPDVTVKNFPKPPEVDTQSIVKAVKGLETALKPTPDDDTPIIEALNNLAIGQTKLAALISKLELAPQIQVAPAEVKIDQPDFKPLEKVIKASKPEAIDLSPVVDMLSNNLKATQDLQKAIAALPKKMPAPIAANVPTDPLIYYLPSDIDDAGGSTGVNYLGYTDNRGAWYIKKMDNSAAPKTIRFSFGQSNYTTNWTNRAALVYTIWGA